MTAAVGTGALAPLRHRAFLLLTAGQLTARLGNAIAPIALAFAVLDLTGSVTWLGIVVAARTAMNVAFVLFGGVVADRLPRQAVMVAASGLSAVSQAAVATLVLSHTATIPLLIALSAVNGMSSAFSFPAASALTPQTVPAAVRQQANALVRMGVNAAMILGASVGGILVASVGPGWGLAVDAATFLLAGALYAGIRVPDARRPAAAPASMLGQLREGWTEFASRTWVWAVVLGFMLFNAVWGPSVMVLGPVIADDTVGRGAWGLVLAGQTAGMVLGGLIALRLRVRRLLFFGVVCVGLDAALPLGMGLKPVLPVLIVAAMLGGLAIEQFGVAWETSMQQHIPADKLARVYSYDILGSLVAIPLGQVAIGPIAGAVGTRTAMIGAAVLIVLVTFAMAASRSVRTLRQDVPPVVEPEPVMSTAP